MPELFLELLCEEIPARMQKRASDDLKKMITDKLVDQGVMYVGAKSFVTPRRLSLVIDGLPASQPDIKEERKGPRIGAPEKAIEGFLRGAGLASIDDAVIQPDERKGDFYMAVIEKKGRATEEIIADIVPDVIRSFPWPKSMRWGAASSALGTQWSPDNAKGMSSLKWVRPLQGILCTFGPSNEDPTVIEMDVDGICSSDKTVGHRFMAPDAIRIRRHDDYETSLRAAKVIIDRDERKDVILHGAQNLALANGLELIEDAGLLEEVAGLVEWPVPLLGRFDNDFLSIPPEVIQLTIKANQKCFVLRDQATGKLSNGFILTANIEAVDGGKEIIAGNERVIRARLSDAAFFWETDKTTTLNDRVSALDTIVFHKELGSQGDRVRRFTSLARDVFAQTVGADPSVVGQAATLAKADLVTEMVGEFPELQGTMGKYYALEEGIEPDVANALEAHYQPQGPSDDVPKEPVSVAVALADKFDTLVGFWVIGETPTSSKDPYALRRAALGIIRIAEKHKLDIVPRDVFSQHVTSYRPDWSEADYAEIVESFQSFFDERQRVYLRDDGRRHDLLDAVFSSEGTRGLSTIFYRVGSLSVFLGTDEGSNLLAGYRRAVNILKAEERHDGVAYEGQPDPAFFKKDEEKALFDASTEGLRTVSASIAEEKYQEALKALSALREPLDLFFENVTVNDDNPIVRRNRLCLLNKVREAAAFVADFSKIEG